MVKNAESLKKDLVQFNERADGPLFKMKDDPRVTKIGKFLRKTSLDEVPQLLNVLKGEMSFIGPRPQLPEEVVEYSDRDYLRLECIPGISCLPQVYGRDTLNFRDWIELDLQYRKDWSLKMDIQVLLKTIKIVIRPLLDWLGKGLERQKLVPESRCFRWFHYWEIPDMMHIEKGVKKMAKEASAVGSAVERFGEFLVRMGVITNGQVDIILAEQKKQPRKKFGELAVELGFSTGETVESFLSKKERNR
jgi:hypothetical protein